MAWQYCVLTLAWALWMVVVVWKLLKITHELKGVHFKNSPNLADLSKAVLKADAFLLLMEYVPWATSSDAAHSWSAEVKKAMIVWSAEALGAYMCCMWPAYLLQGWISYSGSGGGVPKRGKILFPHSAVKILLLYFESSELMLVGLQLFKEVINISDILLNAVCFDYQTLL